MSYFSNPYTPRNFEDKARHTAACLRCGSRAEGHVVRRVLHPTVAELTVTTMVLCGECSIVVDQEISRRVWGEIMGAVELPDHKEALCDSCLKPIFKEALLHMVMPIPIADRVVNIDLDLCPQCTHEVANIVSGQIAGEIEGLVGGGRNANCGQWEQV